MSKEGRIFLQGLYIKIWEKLTMLKFVLPRQQYKKRNIKVLIINTWKFFGFRLILCCASCYWSIPLTDKVLLKLI